MQVVGKSWGVVRWSKLLTLSVISTCKTYHFTTQFVFQVSPWWYFAKPYFWIVLFGRSRKFFPFFFGFSKYFLLCVCIFFTVGSQNTSYYYFSPIYVSLFSFQGKYLKHRKWYFNFNSLFLFFILFYCFLNGSLLPS